MDKDKFERAEILQNSIRYCYKRISLTRKANAIIFRDVEHELYRIERWDAKTDSFDLWAKITDLVIAYYEDKKNKFEQEFNSL